MRMHMLLNVPQQFCLAGAQDRGEKVPARRLKNRCPLFDRDAERPEEAAHLRRHVDVFAGLDLLAAARGLVGQPANADGHGGVVVTVADGADEPPERVGAGLTRQFFVIVDEAQDVRPGQRLPARPIGSALVNGGLQLFSEMIPGAFQGAAEFLRLLIHEHPQIRDAGAGKMHFHAAAKFMKRIFPA